MKNSQTTATKTELAARAKTMTIAEVISAYLDSIETARGVDEASIYWTEIKSRKLSQVQYLAILTSYRLNATRPRTPASCAFFADILHKLKDAV